MSGKLDVSLVAVSALLAAGCASSTGIRRFPDRPVAWQEHDDEDVPVKPRVTPVLEATRFMEDDIMHEADRELTPRRPMPALDVNALDEVPCSTWFCPRNHLHPLDPAVIAAGPMETPPPTPPFVVVHGKDNGQTSGFLVDDARGRRYLLKLDLPGRWGMAAGAEAVSSRLLWAAGYNAPSAYVVDVAPDDFRLAPGLSLVGNGNVRRPFHRDDLDRLLGSAAHGPDGRIRAVAVGWLRGGLGPFSSLGRRPDDPNDRIPHERRRSLRASWVLMAWLDNADAVGFNDLDVYSASGGRHFVRHYWIDLGGSLGSWSRGPKTPDVGAEYYFAPARWGLALISLGLYHRRWEGERRQFDGEARRYESIGYLPADSWRPDDFRTIGRVPAQERMTLRDAYWGAKLVSSFTDAQIEAAVSAGRYPEDEARLITRALEVRRDAIAREYLTRVTAVENPTVADDGAGVCFDDLAIARGVVAPAQVVYRWTLRDGEGRALAYGTTPAHGERTCLRAPDQKGGEAGEYRFMEVRARVRGRDALAAYVHAAYRPAERRFVFVGIDRDE